MEAVVVRAGALGDLLRRSLAVLQSVGYSPRLLSPPAGDALVGPGPAAAQDRLPWEGTEMAELLAGRPTGGPLAEALAQAALVVAYSRSPAVRELLEPRAGRTLFVDPTPPAPGPHASIWLAKPLEQALGASHAAAAQVPGKLQFSPAERRAAQDLLSSLPRGFLAIHPGSGSAAKSWPLDHFRALADALAARDPWLLVRGPAEEGRAWEREPPAPAVVADKLPLRVLGAVLAEAGLFVGNDSGVSHLAAAAGAPTLALFGPTDPALWAPVGPSVLCLRAGAAPAAITVDDAQREATRLRASALGLRSEASGPPAG